MRLVASTVGLVEFVAVTRRGCPPDNILHGRRRLVMPRAQSQSALAGVMCVPRWSTQMEVGSGRASRGRREIEGAPIAPLS
eukprot:2205916-Prymnesium_polylepis.2